MRKRKRKPLSGVPEDVKIGIFSDCKEMYKRRDARAELLFCQSKPIAFLWFSLPSPSSLLKLRNLVLRAPLSISKGKTLGTSLKDTLFKILNNKIIYPV